MKVTKQNKGITLIALVITIIVMLILVAVTINMAVNGGLFGYAGNAARETEQAKNDEKNWTSVEGGLTTEQLIAKFTTNKAEDLAKLRLYFTGSREPNGPGKLVSEVLEIGKNPIFKNNEIIPDASTSITRGTFPLEGDIPIKYHDNYYRVSWIIVDSDDNPITLNEFEEPPEGAQEKFTSVDSLSDSIVIANIIMSNELEYDLGTIDDTNYYRYNNKTYKIIEGTETWEAVEVPAEETAEIRKVTITFGEGANAQRITFVPTDGEKWIDWANSTGDDVDLSSIQSGLTLKGLIRQQDSTTDKKIETTNYALCPPASGIPELTTTTITHGREYYFMSTLAEEVPSYNN